MPAGQFHHQLVPEFPVQRLLQFQFHLQQLDLDRRLRDLGCPVQLLHQSSKHLHPSESFSRTRDRHQETTSGSAAPSSSTKASGPGCRTVER